MVVLNAMLIIALKQNLSSMQPAPVVDRSLLHLYSGMPVRTTTTS
jgi:hypothetical protein